MKANGINIARNQELQILVVFYMGDEGGISCDVTPPDMKKTPIITSITHIKIEPSHPLADEIRAYQAERTRKLARSGGSRKPTHFTIKPRKRRRRRR